MKRTKNLHDDILKACRKVEPEWVDLLERFSVEVDIYSTAQRLADLGEIELSQPPKSSGVRVIEQAMHAGGKSPERYLRARISLRAKLERKESQRNTLLQVGLVLLGAIIGAVLTLIFS